jgi:hypothetical protein
MAPKKHEEGVKAAAKVLSQAAEKRLKTLQDGFEKGKALEPVKPKAKAKEKEPAETVLESQGEGTSGPSVAPDFEDLETQAAEELDIPCAQPSREDLEKQADKVLELVSAKEKRLMQSNMSQQLRNSQNEDQQAVWGEYSSLSRGPAKDRLLILWDLQKNCKWQNSYFQKTFKTTESETDRSVQGYGTVYDVAKLMNCSYESQKVVVDCVCESLESDDNWDETDLFQRGYLKAGLRRYHINKTLLSKSGTKQGSTEEITSQQWRDSKGASSVHDALTGRGGEVHAQEAKVAIKIERPEFQNMKVELKSLETAHVAVSAILKEAKAMTMAVSLVEDCSDFSKLEKCGDLIKAGCKELEQNQEAALKLLLQGKGLITKNGPEEATYKNKASEVGLAKNNLTACMVAWRAYKEEWAEFLQEIGVEVKPDKASKPKAKAKAKGKAKPVKVEAVA